MISLAFASSENVTQTGEELPTAMAYLYQFGPLVLIILVFYFLLIRPQQKRAKEHSNMISSLQKGDEVVTHAGIIGRITGIDENIVTLEIADGVQIKHQKNAIGSKISKDIKS